MAEEKLRVLLDEIAKEKNLLDYRLEVTPFTTGGANYSSTLFYATISAPNHEDLHLFSKVLNISEEMRNMVQGNDAFDTEPYFYMELNQVYEALQEKYRVPGEHRLIVPKFYKCNRKPFEEVLVLENLAVKGFSIYNRMKSITWEYAAAAVGQLVKLHALSFAYKRENPKEFAEVVERLPFLMGNEEMGNIIHGKFLPAALEVLKEEYQERLKSFFNAPNRFNQFASFLKMNNRNVLIHVDYRQSNLVHRRKNGKLEVIPVDFQTMCAGNPVIDLMYFIFSGSDGQFRKYYYKNLIEYYYSELTAALRRLSINIDDVYPRNDYNTDLKDLEMYGLLVCVMLLPIVCVETENAPDISEGAKISDFNMVPSDEFKRRMNDVVEDYIKWGLL